MFIQSCFIYLSILIS